MTIEQVKKEIIAVIVQSTQTQMQITGDTHLIKEMGLSSVETLMVVSDLEDRFGIHIPGSKLNEVRTVNDLSEIVIDRLMQP